MNKGQKESMVQCPGCNYETQELQLYSCELCDGRFCDNCKQECLICDNGQVACSDCVSDCHYCETSFCDEHGRGCTDCDIWMCEWESVVWCADCGYDTCSHCSGDCHSCEMEFCEVCFSECVKCSKTICLECRKPDTEEAECKSCDDQAKTITKEKTQREKE